MSRKRQRKRFWLLASGVAGWAIGVGIAPVMALPVQDQENRSDDGIPEEILRTEIILEARSPIDGEPLTAAEYAELQEQLMAPDRVPELPSEVRHTIFLLRVLRTFRVFNPL